MPVELIKYDFYRGAQKLGELWNLRRDHLTLICAVSTHRLGWELRLGTTTNVSRSQVCKSQSEVLETAAKWKAEAARQGWTEAPVVAAEAGN